MIKEINRVLGLAIFTIVAIVFIGVTYGQALWENRQLRIELGLEDTEYLPIRYIFVTTKGSKHIQQLIDMSIKARHDVDIKTNCVVDKNGMVRTIFSNGDEVVVYDFEEAQMLPLLPYDKAHFVHKIFVDSELPDSAARATIERLGLIDYIVSIGICSPKGGKQ